MELKHIKNIVESEFNFKDISVSSKKGYYPSARSVYCQLSAFFFETMSLAKIGNPIKRDHATVIHSNNMFDEYIKNPIVKRAYDNSYIRFYELLKKNAAIELNIDHDSKITHFYFKKKIEEIKEHYNEKINDLILIHNLENKKLKSKIHSLKNGSRINEMLSELSIEQVVEVEERMSLIIKMILSRKTHDNTPKSSFNVKTSREMIEL
jgi:hypothetical protein